MTNHTKLDFHIYVIVMERGERVKFLVHLDDDTVEWVDTWSKATFFWCNGADYILKVFSDRYQSKMYKMKLNLKSLANKITPNFQKNVGRGGKLNLNYKIPRLDRVNKAK